MFRKYLLIALTSLAIAGCVENPRATGINEPDETDDGTAEATNVQSTFITSTGGRAVSPDGKFSILIGPRVFDSTIEMFITQDDVAEEGLTVMTPRYSVTYNPPEVTPFSDASFRAQFEVEYRGSAHRARRRASGPQIRQPHRSPEFAVGLSEQPGQFRTRGYP